MVKSDEIIIVLNLKSCRMPLEYSWSRADKPFPPGTLFRHDNRVMVIPRARFEDGGKYTCKVMKLTGKQNVATRSIVLFLEGTVVVTHMF